MGVQFSWTPYFYFMANLALGHAFTGKELFQNFPIEKLQMTNEQCKTTYSDGNKRDLCQSIFVRGLELIVNDIIENNVHFKLPSMGQTSSSLCMTRTQGNDFKRAFKNGKWRDVDFIRSNFTGYQLGFKMDSAKRIGREKPVYISKHLKDKITEYTNKGRSY